LSAAEIIATATKLSQEHGIDGFTVRMVSEELKVSQMALYQHFADKRALVDAVADVALGHIVAPARDGQSWVDWMIAQAQATMRVFVDYPGLASYVLGQGPIFLSEQAVRVADGILEVLHDAGFSELEAAHIYSASFSFVAGHVQLHSGGVADVAGIEGWLDGPAASRYAAFARVTRALGADLEGDEIFEYGLRCLFAGVQINRDRTGGAVSDTP
jgi:TetR/AcrR family tetracycline transcriptional repressor